MALTWRDFVTSALALMVIIFSYLGFRGVDIPFLSGNRISLLVLLIIGLAMCIIGGSSQTSLTGPWNIISTALGILVFVLILIGLILGTGWTVYTVAVLIAFLWLISTFLHLIGA